MGAEDTPKRGFFSTRTTFKNRSTIFTLGSRDTVLTTELEDPIIIVPHAQKTEKKVRKYHHHCIDTDMKLKFEWNLVLFWPTIATL